MNRERKRKILGLIFGIIFYVFLISSLTFAYYSWTSDHTSVNLKLHDGGIKFVYDDNNRLTGNNLSGVLDYTNSNYYTEENNGRYLLFSEYTATNTKDVAYKMYAKLNVKTLSNTLKSNAVKWVLQSKTTQNGTYSNVVNGGSTITGTFANMNIGSNDIYDNIYIIPGETIYYRFVVYIDGNVNSNISGSIDADLELCDLEIAPIPVTLGNHNTIGSSTINYSTRTIYESYGRGIYLNENLTNQMSTSANNVTVPTAVGYTFTGFYDNNTQLLSNTGYITNNFNNDRFISAATLEDKWTENTYSITTINNGGTITPSKSSGIKYESDVINITATKNFTVNITNSDTATLSSNSISGYQIFDGWTSTSGLSTSTAKYGSSSSPNTSWNNANTKVKGSTSNNVNTTYFKQLSATSGGTVNLTANWTAATITLGTATKAGYTCGYSVESTATTLDYASAANYVSNLNATTNDLTTTSRTLYAKCLANKVTITVKKDGSNYGSSLTTDGMQIALYQNGTVTYAYNNGSYNSSNSSVTWTGVVDGEYDIYISKDKNHTSTLIDSGIDATVTTTNSTTAVNTTGTVNFYTLKMVLNNSTATVNGTNVSNNGTVVVAGGTGTAANNYEHAIVATPSNGYTFSNWSSNGTVTFGSTTTTSTTAKIASAATITATTSSNSYTITLKTGTGASTLTESGWTGSPGATLTKSISLGTKLTMSNIEVTNTTGYHGSNWTKTSGSGTLANGTFTVGAGDATLTASGIANTYTVKFATGNASCTLSTATYSDIAATYNQNVNSSAIANPTCTGYGFTGWTLSGDKNTDTAKYGTTSSPATAWVDGNKGTYFKNLSSTNNGTVTLTAGWKMLNYQNTTTNEYYEHLNEAMSAVASNQTIKVLNGIEETTAATLTSGKVGVTLDLNGNTTTLSGVVLNNSGSLNITDSGSGGALSGTGTQVINNGTGTLTVSSGTVTGTQNGINTGTGPVTVNGGTVKTTGTANSSYGIYKDGATGKVTLSSGTITGKKGIYNKSNSDLIEITGGEINGSVHGIYNYSSSGTINITGGTIIGGSAIGYNGSATSPIIVNGSNARVEGTSNYGIMIASGSSLTSVTVTSGTVTGRSQGIINTNGRVIVNGGYVSANTGQSAINASTVTVSSGTIINNSDLAIFGDDITINGGLISGATYGIEIFDEDIINITGGLITGTTSGIYSPQGGSINISGGTVSGVSHGIHMVGAGTLTMGTNDGGTPSTTIPLIKTTGTSGVYGVKLNNASAVYNFYDGRVTSASGTGKSINYSGTINTPEGYHVHKSTSDGVETAILSNSNTITLKKGTGASTLTASDWTGSPGGTLTKTLTYGTNIELSDITVANTTGYHGSTWTKTSGNGTVNGGTFTVGSGDATLTISGIINTYKVKFASSNASCTLSTVTYSDINATYNENVNDSAIANPTCSGYEFTGWTLSGDKDTSTAKYGTTNEPSTAWADGNKGTYFKNLSSSNNGTVTLTAGWMAYNYKNTSTNTYYEHLNEALSAVQSDQTIKVLNGISETTSATLTSGKVGVTLDLNGNTTTLSGNGIYNSGSLNITDTGNGGVLSGTGTSIINNGTGTLTVTGGTITGNNSQVISVSTGLVKINGANVKIEGTGNSGILLTGTGTINISNGTVRGAVYGINLNTSSTGKVIINGGIVESYGTGNAHSGILNNGSVSNIDISGGTITGKKGIYNNFGGGTINVTGGTITGNYGIDHANSTVTCSITVNGENAKVEGTSGPGIAGKIGTISMNNGTVTGTTDGIASTNGEITVSGGYISNANTGVSLQGENGSATISGGTITGTVNGVSNGGAGIINITGGKITGTTYGAYNYYSGTINVTGGTITGNDGMGSGGNNGEIKINGTNAKVSGTTTSGIFANGQSNRIIVTKGTVTGASYGIKTTAANITINGGYVETTGSNDGIYTNSNNVNIVVSSGTVTGYEAGIYSGGSIGISGGKVIGTTKGTHCSSCTLTISGGTVTGNTGVLGRYAGVSIAVSGANTKIEGTNGPAIQDASILTVTGGTISGSTYGIKMGGTLTMGENGGTPSTTIPLIKATNTSNAYGVYLNDTSAVYNFYDGRVTSASGTGKSIYYSGTINTPEGYHVHKSTADGVETAILSNSNTITLKTGTGASTLTASGWTDSPGGTLTKAFTYGTNIELSDITVANATGYHGSTWTKTSGNGTVNGGTFTVGESDATLTISGIPNTYKVKFASSNASCTLSTATYSDINATYNENISNSAIANPTCSGYEFTGWTLSGDKDTSTAKYGTTNEPSTAWTDGNKGTYFKNLSTTNNGTVTLTAGWMALNYQNTSTNNYYGTLNAALNAVQSNQTIKVINGIEETTAATLTAGKVGVTLDLNGNTTTLSGVVLKNSGSLNITDSGSGGVISAISGDAINGDGTLTLSAGTISSSLNAISTGSGEINVDGTNAKINAGQHGILVSGAGFAYITKGTITASSKGMILSSHSSGTLIVDGGYVESTSTNSGDAGIYNANTGRVIVSGGTVLGSNGIYTNSSGIVDVTGGVVTGNIGISKGGQTAGTITVYGTYATVQGVSGVGIYGGNAEVNIINGTVTGSTHGISSTTGVVIVDGGYVASTATSGNYDGINKSNESGSISVSSGTIIGYRSGIYSNAASPIAISGGSITGNTGIRCTGVLTVTGATTNIRGITGEGIDAYTGTVTMSNGTVTGTNGIWTSSGDVIVNGGYVASTGTTTLTYGIKANGSISLSGGTILGYGMGIWNNGGTLNISSGYVKGTASTSSSGVYGSPVIMSITGGTVTGPQGISHNASSSSTITINGTNALVEGTSGSGINIKGKVTVIAGSVTGTQHGISLGDGEITISGGYVASTATTGNSDGINKTGAGSIVVSGGTITGYRSGINSSTGTIDVSGGHIIGNTGITQGTNNTLTINGSNVRIEGISETGVMGGNGTTTISKGLITGSSYGVRVMNTTGVLTVNGGTITGSQIGIYSQNASTINVLGGYISSTDISENTNSGLYHSGDVATITVSGGTITGYNGIYNNPVTITGGFVSGTVANGIYKSNGNLTVTGGTVTGATKGINIDGTGTLTMGENSGTPSTTIPLIRATNTSNAYGVYIGNASAIYNFYDGKVTSASGTGKSISYSGTINKPNTYYVKKTTDGGVETAILSNEYRVTLEAGTGVSSLTASGWTGSPGTTISKIINAGTNISLSDITVSYTTGYNGSTWTKTSGSGTVSGNTFTVGGSNATLTITGIGSTYKVKFASGNASCTLSTATYSDIDASFGENISSSAIANPTCSGYEFDGWALSGNKNTDTAKYGTTNNPTTAWVDGNKGTYFKDLSTTNNGTVTLTARWISPNYKNTTTNNYYETLNAALNAVQSNQTIKVLKGITETTDSTLTASKVGVTLDLNGNTTTLSGKTLYNSGSLNVTDTGSGGVLSGTGNPVINSSTGTLTVTSGTITGTQNAISSTTGVLTINGGYIKSTATTGNYDGIYKNGTTGSVTISSGTIIGYRAGIYNNNNAPISVTGGTVTGKIGIYNYSSGSVTINGTNAKVEGTSGNGITGESGTITVTKGTVTGSTNGIIISSTGKAVVNGGYVSSSSTNNNDGIIAYGTSNTVISSGTVIGNRAGVYNDGAGTVTISGGSVSGTTVGLMNRNNGIVNITGGTISGANGIQNWSSPGIVIVNGDNVKIESSDTGLVGGSGTITVSKGFITGIKSGVSIANSTGVLTINGGTITAGQNGIVSQNASTINVLGGYISSTDTSTNTKSGLYQVGGVATITVSGGTITGYTGIYNNSSSSLTVNGGFVSGTVATGIYQSHGTLTVTGGTIVGSDGVTVNSSQTDVLIKVNGPNAKVEGTSNAGIIGYRGSVNVSNGSVIGVTTGATVSNGTMTITGGTVTGTTYGVSVDNGILTMGENGGTPSTTIPLIKATGTTDAKGVYIKSQNATYNFYDGKVTSASGTGTSISYGGIINTPTNYDVVKSTSSDIETAILAASNNYQNMSTNTKYMYLYKALREVESNQTIKVLTSSTETTAATLTAGKVGVTLDLNGKTTTLNSVNIVNNGSLTITGSSGVLSGTASNVINNGTGTLTVSGGTITGTQTVISSTTGPVTVNGGRIESTATTGNNDGIYNNGATGAVTVTSGTIIGYRAGIYSNTASPIAISGGSITGNTGIWTSSGDVTVTGGRIESTATTGNYDGIFKNGTTGTITVTSGTIIGYRAGIYSNAANPIAISGGSITGNTGIRCTGVLTVTGATTNIRGITGAGIDAYTGTVTMSNGTVTGNNGIWTSSGDVIVNGGYVASTGTTTLTYGIKANGSISLSGGTILGYGMGIWNNGGTLNISSGYVKGTASTSSSGVYGSPVIMSITGGTVTGPQGISHNASSSSTITINGTNALVEGTSGSGINIKGKVTVIAGSVTGTQHGISLGDGEITISGGYVASTATSGSYDGINKDSTGTVTISGGTVIGYRSGLWNNVSSFVNIDGGLIRGNTGVMNYRVGVLTVTGGTITGVDRGIDMSGGTGSLTMGENGGTPSTTIPLIRATGTSNAYGVYISNASAVYNFYDGKVTSASGTGKSINYSGTINTPTGYVVTKSTSSGTETAILTQPQATIYLKENGSTATNTGYAISLSTSSTTNSNTFSGTTTSDSISLGPINSGTIYYVWAGKSSNDKTNKVYTGVSFTGTNSATSATINYYGLTLEKGTGISSVVNDNAVTTNQINHLYGSTTTISATVTSSEYTWDSWTKTTGTQPASFTTSTRSQNIIMGAGAVTLTANATANTYKITYQGNGGSNQAVTNLISKYDGYYNATNSHSTSTTSWTDMKLQHTGTVTIGTGSWGDRYFNLAGSNSSAILGYMPTNNITIETTFSTHYTGGPSNTQYVVCDLQSGGSSIYIQKSTGYISADSYIDGALKYIRSDVSVEANRLYHVVYTFNGTKQYIYIDSVKYDTGTYTTSGGTITYPQNNTNMAIGGNPNGTSISNASGEEYFNGDVYNVAIYSTALTDAQVVQDYGKSVTFGSTYGDLPVPLRGDGYVFTGWWTSPDNSGTQVTDEDGHSLVSVSITSDHTLYAHWMLPNWYITKNGTTTYYETLSSAVSAASSGDTIYANRSFTDSSEVTIGKNITININGKTVTRTKTTTISNGYTTTVTGSGTLKATSEINIFTNNGTLNLTHSGTISNTSTGKAIVNNDSFSANVTVNATGTISTSSKNAIRNEGAGTITLTNGVITSSSTETNDGESATVGNRGTGRIILNGATVKNTGTAIALDNGSSGDINVLSGTIISEESNAIWNNDVGNIVVDGGTVTSSGDSASTIANFEGTITISSGIVISENDNAISNKDNGTIIITGGTVTGEGDAVTIWNNLGTVTVSGGYIYSASRNGIQNQNTSVFTMTGGVINTDDDSAIWHTSTTSKNITLSGGTINTRGSYSAVANSGSGTVEISGTHIVQSDNGDGVLNEGSGKIVVSSTAFIESLNSGSAVKISSGSFQMTGGTLSGVTGIRNVNSSVINVTGGVINSTSSSGAGIWNSNDGLINFGGSAVLNGYDTIYVHSTSTGTINVTGGTINATNSAIYSFGNDGTDEINISGGRIISSGSIGVATKSIFTMSSGKIEAIGTALRYYGSGTATLTGGTVTGGTYGVNLTSSGVFTMGQNGGTPSTTVPLIQATGTTDAYGINISDSSATFNFYDGKVTSASGTGNSIICSGTIKTQSKYKITKSTSNGVETAILTKK